MKRNITFFLILTLICSSAFAQKLTRQQYIDKYKNIAIRQMKTYGIPASIILAQACLESNNGNSTLAREGKNHFGIKCAGWQGRKVFHDDDAKNECFRAYRNAEESFLDHSDFLRYRKRYAFLFDLKTTDYKGWAKGLKKAGYATAPTYASSLIKIIEDYQLYKYDDKNYKPSKKDATISSKEVNTKTHKASKKNKKHKQTQEKIIPVKKPSEAIRDYNIDNFVVTINRSVNKRNGVKYVIAKHNDTYERIGDEFNLSGERLRRYNDDSKNSQPQEGDLVYIEKKKAKAGKDFPMHISESGETLREIAQQYGVSLQNLCRKNNLQPADTLIAEQVIYLRDKPKETP